MHKALVEARAKAMRRKKEVLHRNSGNSAIRGFVLPFWTCDWTTVTMTDPLEITIVSTQMPALGNNS